ncbi:response regulator [Bdellovibrio sp. HCB337]|uniref:response regulator n=1 Tax=Bdellovibrio sp. HCB337 TaxID=3394358 RepID=UPI0039A5AB57
MKGNLLDTQNDKPTIAFVDDEAEITEVYSAILSEHYKVLTFNQPEELLKFLEFHEACPFEVLITDLKMPKISGLQLIERAHQKGFQFPSLLLSGYLDKSNLMTAVGSGVLRVIEKPADISRILQCVEELMNEARLMKTRRQIHEIMQKLRESYSHIRMLLGDELETYTIDNDSNMEILLESLESRLDFLLKAEENLKLKSQATKKVV